jgi:hypothetical protein
MRLGWFTRQPELTLLIDGGGAILSAICLGVVLPMFQAYVGMPRRVLLALAIVALLFSAWSIGCYVLRRTEWRTGVRVISVLNLVYCGVTAVLVAAFWSQLTRAGVTYFLLEILVIGALVAVERRVLASAGGRRQNHQRSSANSTAPR